jgi:hypothetical protein
MAKAKVRFWPVSISGCEIVATLIARDGASPASGSHHRTLEVAHQCHVHTCQRNCHGHEAQRLCVVADGHGSLDSQLRLAHGKQCLG